MHSNLFSLALAVAAAAGAPAPAAPHAPAGAVGEAPGRGFLPLACHGGGHCLAHVATTADDSGCALLQKASSKRTHSGGGGSSSGNAVLPGAGVTSTGATQNLAERIRAAPNAAARLELAKPLVWVHVPKAGTAMVNIFYSHPGICPLAPSGVKMPEGTLKPDAELFEEFPPDEYCPGSFPDDRPLTEQARHFSFSPLYWKYKGHIVEMFRQPEQRLLSDYYDVHFRSNHSWGSPTPPRDARHFAEELQGCATKMLARPFRLDKQVCRGPGSPPPTERESALAVKRLREGFAFVGITDQWDLSVCLFHAKFGGECQPAEFGEVRLGAKRNSSDQGYDTSELRGFVDEMDGRLFAEATRIFQSDLSRYHVSDQFCARRCWPRDGAMA